MEEMLQRKVYYITNKHREREREGERKIMEKKKDGWKENSQKSAEFNVKVFSCIYFIMMSFAFSSFVVFFFGKYTHFSPKVFLL